MKRAILLLFLSLLLVNLTYSQWSPANGLYGGDIRCLAKSGTDVYAGSAYGGVFKSTDNGNTWNAKIKGLPGNVAVMVLLPTDNYVYAGTGYWSNSGKGVYRSSDGGNTWVPKNNGIGISGSFNDLNITGLARNSSIIFASTKANGIYKSLNNGDSWIKIFDQFDPDSAFRDINAITFSAGYLFAGGSTGCIFRSSNNGASWEATTTGLPAGVVIYQMTSAGTDVYATTSHGFFWSDNNGNSWVNISNGITNTIGCKTLSAEGSILYASTWESAEGAKTYKSLNKGATWTHIPALNDYMVLALLNSGNNVFAGNVGNFGMSANGGGIVRSVDDGDTWSQSVTGLSGINVMCISSNSASLFSGTRFYSGLFNSQDQGSTWNKSTLPGTTSNYSILSILANGTNVFAGVNTSGVYYSADNGQTWSATAAIGYPVYALGAHNSYIFAGTSNQGMRRSSNNGTSWTTINTGLPSVGEKSVRSMAVYGSTLYIGTSRGVFISVNDGTNWTAANGGAGSPGYGQVKALAVKGDTIFGGSSNGVIRSFNKGITWSLISSGITIGNTNALYLDGSTLYAGGTGGVFRSTDWGETWNTLNGTLPMNFEIYSLYVTNGILYAGTYGQSMWFLMNPDTPPPSPFMVTGSGNYCEGSGGLSIGLSGSEINVTYQLMQNDIILATLAGTGGPINFGNYPAGTYTVIAVGIGGIVNMTGSAVIEEIPVSPVSVSIAADQNDLCEGSLITFTATPVNGGNATYQWYLNGNPVGTNSQQYTVQPVNGDEVYVETTSDMVCATNNPAISNTIEAIINALMPVSATVTEDANNVCVETIVTLTATALNGGSDPSWQWFLNGLETGSDQATYTFIPVNGDQVYAIVTSNLECASNNPATSNIVTLTVVEPTPVSVTINEDVNNVCIGTTVTLTAAPVNGGSSPTYEWFVNNVLTGPNQGTFSFIPANNDEVYAIMTSDQYCISGNPATSNTVVFTVNEPVPVSVTITEDANNFCGSQEVTITAFPVNGGSSPEYIWYVNALQVGDNQSTYSYFPENEDEAYVVMISNLDCSWGSPVASNFIEFNIEEELTPAVTITASENPVTAGAPVTFTATFENGGDPSFQWFVNNIPMATGPTFTYIPSDGDEVYAIMTSTLECVTTPTAISNTIIIDVIIGIADIGVTPFKVYANGNTLYIENYHHLAGIIGVYDLKGTKLNSYQLTGKELMQISTGLGNGLYLIRITGSSVNYIAKVFIN